MSELTGKVIFLTGAGGVSGKSHISHFLMQGARVIATDRNISALEMLAEEIGAGDRLMVASLDVTNEDAIADCFEQITPLSPSVFVNNAAITGEQMVRMGEVPGALADCSLASWRAAMDVNLTAAFLVAREMDRRFIGKRPCKLINVSSMYGLFSPHHRIYDGHQIKPFPAYSASKAGLHGLTVWLAGYWAGKHTTVNTLSPGGVYNKQDPELVADISRLNMMSRMAKAPEISKVMAFLASSSSDYMTGQNIYVDGGFSAW
ncbi:SDR family oxidoreductase [Parasphingorhabdus sp.]|jgi:3-oxoacyl-[acyl-carrier protein] reductase|uniref:SDR family oxidoreductase n=1 Tax=Parasphingorhabdus sp. TaxID=2709688 RepID=UPI0032EDE192